MARILWELLMPFVKRSIVIVYLLNDQQCVFI